MSRPEDAPRPDPVKRALRQRRETNPTTCSCGRAVGTSPDGSKPYCVGCDFAPSACVCGGYDGSEAEVYAFARAQAEARTEQSPRARLILAFHERTRRCVGSSGEHLECSRIERLHREGNHVDCLPAEDIEAEDYVALRQALIDQAADAVVAGKPSPARIVTEHRCSLSPALAAEMEAARDSQPAHTQPDDHDLSTALGRVAALSHANRLLSEGRALTERGEALLSDAIRATEQALAEQTRTRPPSPMESERW